MSSYSNLNSVTKTLASRIWNGIKDDKELKAVIKSEKQITYLMPDTSQKKSSQLSIFLYNFMEIASMRNQPPSQDPKKPRALLHLNLRYLITPTTENAETDQMVLERIMQLLAEFPVIAGSDLQGNLSECCDHLRISLDELTVDDLSKLWTMFQAPYRLCASYSVYPIAIMSSAPAKPQTAVIIKPPAKGKKTTEKKSKKTA